MSGRKVMLLDGYSLAFRAYFALPTSIVTSAGQVTNAVYGFTSMLLKMLADERPDAIAVAFDRAAPTFRDEKYAEYKAGRSATPDDFKEQIGLLREVLDVMRIPIIELDGYEADDILATMARRAVEEGDEAWIVTGDRDAFQLVRDGVTVLYTKRGITDIARFDPPAVQERYGVPPAKWTDFVALKGETSDNLPGVPGIGDKTAAQLVGTYGSVEEVVAHADELRPKIRDALKEMAEQVLLNKELARLIDEVPIDVDPDELRLEPWDDEEVRKLFTSLEFRTLYQRLKEMNLTASVQATSFEDVDLEPLREGEVIEATGEPVAIGWDPDHAWVAVTAGDRPVAAVAWGLAVDRLRDLLADASAPKVAHDAKALVREALDAGVELEGLELDTQIAAYLLEPGLTGGYGLPDVVRRYLNVALEDEVEAKPTRSKQQTLGLEDDGGLRAARYATAIRSLGPVLRERLEGRGMWDLARELEFPLIHVLAGMERAGIRVDLPYLEELASDLGDRMRMLEKRIHEAAGEQFNVGSVPQLQRILFEKLELPKTKRIKTGWSTDQAEMAKLAGVHPIVDALLEYREVAKLKTGFTDALIPLVNPRTGRIHTTYSQVSAATGRLASTNPNLQNVPIRGELGRQIRRAFIAEPKHLLLSADYSQIELRVLAHLTGDTGLLDAFASGHDFHAAIAAKVYGVGHDEVDTRQRGFAKQFSYGIAYGMSAYGVSQRLGVEMEEAREFIDAYYAQFPKVKAFLEAQVARATQDGFTTTMFGRRRYLDELRSPNPRVRAMGERMALNAPIQGTAADIIKRAMIDCDARLRGTPGVATMLLTVHDELVFEVPEDKLEEASTLVKETMESAADLQCGLVVDVRSGVNWSDAHA